MPPSLEEGLPFVEVCMAALVEDCSLCTGELHLLEDGFVFADKFSLLPSLEEGLPFAVEVCRPALARCSNPVIIISAELANI